MRLQEFQYNQPVIDKYNTTFTEWQIAIFNPQWNWQLHKKFLGWLWQHVKTGAYKSRGWLRSLICEPISGQCRTLLCLIGLSFYKKDLYLMTSLNLINLHVLAGCLFSHRGTNLVTKVHKLCLFQQGLLQDLPGTRLKKVTHEIRNKRPLARNDKAYVLKVDCSVSTTKMNLHAQAWVPSCGIRTPRNLFVTLHVV